MTEMAGIIITAEILAGVTAWLFITFIPMIILTKELIGYDRTPSAGLEAIGIFLTYVFFLLPGGTILSLITACLAKSKIAKILGISSFIMAIVMIIIIKWMYFSRNTATY